jgi:spore germination cell wall hydrolase CwlJ-like protein
MNMKLIVASMSLVGLITLPVISESAPTSYTDIQPDVRCLAMNIYHEARSESLAGQYAVADVVLNRVESNRFPDTVCEVVHQARLWEGYPVRNKCQFSWYCDGKTDTPSEMDAWYRSLSVATQMLSVGKYRGLTEGATHYHTDYVDPFWNESMILIGGIGDHIFYLETL